MIVGRRVIGFPHRQHTSQQCCCIDDDECQPQQQHFHITVAERQNPYSNGRIEAGTDDEEYSGGTINLAEIQTPSADGDHSDSFAYDARQDIHGYDEVLHGNRQGG